MYALNYSNWIDFERNERQLIHTRAGGVIGNRKGLMIFEFVVS